MPFYENFDPLSIMAEWEEFLNSSFFEGSDVDGDLESEPRSPASTRRSASAGVRKGSSVKTHLAACNRCNRKYSSLDGYRQHMSKHIFEGRLSYYLSQSSPSHLDSARYNKLFLFLQSCSSCLLPPNWILRGK